MSHQTSLGAPVAGASERSSPWQETRAVSEIPNMIHPEILRHFQDMNEQQRRVVSHDQGPLLVIAGPGSGKTFSLVLRTLNLFLCGKAAPREVVLCTFTEKAAGPMLSFRQIVSDRGFCYETEV